MTKKKEKKKSMFTLEGQQKAKEISIVLECLIVDC